MKQQIQIKISEPCHENWNGMTATEQGRFCGSCCKEVIDFSTMTDVEILSAIAKASSSICGRAGQDQLDRQLAVPDAARQAWWKYWMGIAVSFLMLSTKADAQTKIKKHPVTNHPGTGKKTGPPEIIMGTIAYEEPRVNQAIQGRVVDSRHNPIPYASVRLVASGGGTAADSAGNFILYTHGSDIASVKLMISSVGYETTTIDLGKLEDSVIAAGNHTAGVLNTGEIILASPTLKEVVVTSSQFTRRMMGGLMICRSYTVYDKAKARVKEITGTSEVKVYPNPVTINTPFNISLAIKEQGPHFIQFTDAAGKIAGGRQVYIRSKNQLESFSGSMFTAAGVYFVTVSGQAAGKLYTSRLMVQ